jgi:tRNA threonylcarbamoyladenosine biosynthesis protein TsaE
MIYSINTLADLEVAAKDFVERMQPGAVYAFWGEMGVGKTTFIKAICREMGVKEVVNSPAFAIVNEYETQRGNIIYHFDCYRIVSLQEAIDIGCDEYFYSGNTCLVEWPEKIEGLLPAGTVNVRISLFDNGERTLEAEL